MWVYLRSTKHEIITIEVHINDLIEIIENNP